MAYLVLARKYRPQSFEDVVGQEPIATTLQNAIQFNRVAHAYLFAGQRGVGKTSMARIFAKWLNCSKGPDGGPCHECRTCRGIAAGEDVDVIEIDGASNRGIEQVREIRDNVRYAPSHSPHKVYYIDEVHMLTTEAFNALLKTLEEPPEHVKFIFATTEAHRLPATILSRCQRYDFRPIPASRIADHLGKLTASESVDVDPEALAEIARRAEGSMRDAETLLDQLISFTRDRITIDGIHSVLGTVDHRTICDTLDNVARKDAAAVLATVDNVLAAGKDIGEFIRELQRELRDRLVARAGQSSSEEADPETPADSLTIDGILYMMSALHNLQREIRRGNRDRALVDMVFVKLTRVADLAPVDQLVARIDALSLAPSTASHAQRPRRDGPDSDPSHRAGETASSATSSSAPGAETWHRVLATLKTKNRRLHAQLEKAELVSIDDDRLVLRCRGWLAGTLQQEATRKILSDCTQATLGKTLDVQVVESATGPAAPDTNPPAKSGTADHPLVSRAREMLPGHVVTRKGK